MVLFAITPWRHRNELLDVRDAFYPHHARLGGSKTELDEECRSEACARVAVWVNRGNCPHLVESTASLTAVALDDARSRARMSSSITVRHAYALAFSRFVTGLLDSCQDKAHKLSMYSIAKNIGLPETFVELRHQITHEELPSLQVLRVGADKALAWIWQFYWATLPEAVPLSQIEGCQKTLQKLLDKAQRDEKLNLADIKVDLQKYTLEEKLSSLSNLNYGSDPALQARLLELLTNIVTDGRGSNQASEMVSALSRANYLEEVRQEMQGMDVAIGTQADGTSSQDDKRHDDVNDDTTSYGWSEWDGIWSPKPIGLV